MKIQSLGTLCVLASWTFFPAMARARPYSGMVYRDNAHGTARANFLIASTAYAAVVPEPSAFPENANPTRNHPTS